MNHRTTVTNTLYAVLGQCVRLLEDYEDVGGKAYCDGLKAQ